MPRIVKGFVSERLLPAVAIEDYIDQFVKLKKSGSSYKCCCPFHHEKTPSFNVSPSKQMFYCFGCKEHGNALDFLMKYKNLGFIDAVEELAAYAGVQVEYEQGGAPDSSDKFKAFYEIMDRCATLFTRVLLEERGKSGFEYFTKERGLTRESIVRYRLGFAPEDWHFLERELCRSEQEQRLLVQLGMLVERDGKRFGMYRNRVMIPIFDRKGRVISFGGRTLGDDKPKYLNTKESPIYRKRNELFGLYEALRDNNNRPGRMVIVEGYMDVISLRQAGLSCAVASLGTATTTEQFKLMFRYTKKLVCCYDGDNAGRMAAWHALNTVTPVLTDDVEIRFAFLPPEDDPDSLVRGKGLAAFNEFLDNSLSYPEFLVSHEQGLYHLDDPAQMSRFISGCLGEIRKIPLKALQLVCLQTLSGPSRTEYRVLYDLFTSETPPEPEPVPERTPASTGGILSTPMRSLIAFILQQPTVVGHVYQDFALAEAVELCRRLEVRGSEELASLVEFIWQSFTSGAPAPTPAVLLERVRGTEREKTFRLLAAAPLGTLRYNGEEPEERSVEERVNMLAELIGAVLSQALSGRAQLLRERASALNQAQWQEFTLIERGLKQLGH